MKLQRLNKTRAEAGAEARAKNEGTFDYDKFATALVKAQQLANGKTNFGGSNDKQDISKFF